jgi:hypothetical protein
MQLRRESYVVMKLPRFSTMKAADTLGAEVVGAEMVTRLHLLQPRCILDGIPM